MTKYVEYVESLRVVVQEMCTVLVASDLTAPRPDSESERNSKRHPRWWCRWCFSIGAHIMRRFLFRIFLGLVSYCMLIWKS